MSTKVTDVMADRASRVYYKMLPTETMREAMRCALEAALERRTGPKCRRVEWDDTQYFPGFARRWSNAAGRRATDSDQPLQRKSRRLAEEKAKSEPDIPVSEGMCLEGGQALRDCCILHLRGPHDVWELKADDPDVVKKIFRAMEKKRREEEQQHCRKRRFTDFVSLKSIFGGAAEPHYRRKDDAT